MSKYGETRTVFREEKYLVEALNEMAYQIEIYPEGAPLNSYFSDQEAKVANIVIRRQYLRGAYGAVGFARQPDGRLAMRLATGIARAGLRAYLGTFRPHTLRTGTGTAQMIP